jgi:glycosyltransferase involved in cell wall biosynthesis
MSSAAPLVTVLMAVYNGERYLREAVESTLNQTFRDFEFLIIDDGSTDGTANMLRGFSEADSRVKVHSQENIGQVPTLNRGLKLAAGRYVARMDADDISLPERLALQVEAVEANPRLGVVGTSAVVIDEDGRRIVERPALSGDRDIRAWFQRGNCMMHPTVMIRRKAIEDVGGYRPAFAPAEDYDLWLRISEKWELNNLPQSLLHYRMHGGQLSQKNLVQQAVAAVSAQASARIRRETGRDPADGLVLASMEFLQSCGAREEVVHARVMDDYLTWFKTAVRSSDLGRAEAILKDAVGYSRDRRVGRQVCAEMLHRLARGHWRCGHRGRGLYLLGRGLLAHPIDSLGQLGILPHRGPTAQP